MADFKWVSTNFLRTSLADYGNIGAQGSRDTVTVDANSTGSFKAAWPSGANQTWAASFQMQLPAGHSPAYRKSSAIVRFYFTANPTTTDIGILKVGNTQLLLDTTGKLKIGSTVTGDAALAINTWHTIEMIADKDWRGSGLSSVIVRQNASGTLLQVDGGTLANFETIALGDSQASKTTGPATSAYFNHAAMLTSNDTSNRAPWLNATTVEQDSRVPIANGFNNDYTGVSDNTNKYLNVDESPSNTTDYNNQGAISVTKRQTYTYTAITYSPDTPKGFSIFSVSRAGIGGTGGSGAYGSLIRDNSVNYPEFGLSLTSSFGGFVDGYDGRPVDRSALSSTILNSIEGGTLVLLPNNTGSSVAATNPTGDGATYDGVWTQTGGTGGSAYTAINDGSDLTFITSTGLNNKQGLTFTWVTVPATLDDSITNLFFNIRLQSKVALETNTIQIGVRISGVDYLGTNLFTATTTGFVTVSDYFQYAGSFKNPATGNRFLQSEINSLEFYLQHTVKGATGGVDVSEFTLQPLVLSALVESANFMVVATGSAYTDNGAIPGAGSFLPRLSLLGVG